jgi:hypothetical protein
MDQYINQPKKIKQIYIPSKVQFSILQNYCNDECAVTVGPRKKSELGLEQNVEIFSLPRGHSLLFKEPRHL